MQPIDGAEGLRSRRAIALAGLGLWIAGLAFLSGPVRWELAHTYAHWIEGAEGNLPALTRSFALPILGLAEASFTAAVLTFCFWVALWLGAAAIAWLVWRARSRAELIEVLVLGAAIYGPLVILMLSVFAVGLWLPFSLL